MKTKKKVSIVVPVYYNEESLPRLFEELQGVSLSSSDFDFEFIFVDDFSGDNSYQVLQSYLGISKSKIKILKLSKNHGSFTACLAGLTKSDGDCAVIISADLQDPPALISKMISEWSNGYEVVIAARNSRKDSFFTKIFATMFYWLIRRYALTDMPKGGFDFVLFDRKIIDIVCEIKEKNTSLMGLIIWAGFKRKVLYYDRQTRKRGSSRWTLAKKIKYFIDSFVSFSFVPIRLATIVGFTVSFLGFLYTVFIIYERLVNKQLVQGIVTLIALVLFLGGAQLIILGIIGEYLWRILDETRKRPPFIIDKFDRN